MNKKAFFRAVSVLVSMVLVFTGAQIWNFFTSASNSIPIFNKDDHTDILNMTGIGGANMVGYEYSESNGGRMWTDSLAGGNLSIKEIGDSLVKRADYIYGSGALLYKASTYAPNQAYHYAYVPIVKISEGSKVGYLALKAAAGGTSVKLSFIIPDGASTSEAAVLYDFSTVTTNIGTAHDFAYKIDTQNYELSVWLNGVIILNEYVIDSKYSVESLAVGAGRLNASFQVSNYRVWRTTPIPSYELPVFNKDNDTDILDMTGISGANMVGYQYNQENGGRMWTDSVNGGNIAVRSVDKSITNKADYIYGSGSMLYKTSGYLPNQAYHYGYVTIAQISEDNKTGYLALKFAAGGQSVKLSFINAAGESTSEYAVLSNFNSVTTNIGTEHNFAYQIDVNNYALTVWLNGKAVLTDYVLDSKYTVDSLCVGSGRYYASFQVANYRVWRTTPIPSYELPVFNKDKDTDILDMSGITGANWVGYTYDADNGGRMWTDTLNGGNVSVRPVDNSLIDKTDFIYGSGSMLYKGSGYPANQAYHYGYVVIARMDDGEKSGYLALKFAAGGQSVKLSFINPDGENTTDYAVLSNFSTVTTNIGTEHSFAYRIDTNDYTLCVWLNGQAVVTDFMLDTKYVVDCLAVGSGRFYAGFQLSNYRVWRNDPVPELIIPVPQFNDETDVNLVPYAQAATSRIAGVLKNEKYILSQTQNTIGSAFFRNVNLEDDGTMYYHAVINNDSVNHSTNANVVYDGPSIALGSVTLDETGETGYLVLRFTSGDGIDFRITARNGSDVYYLGARSGMKFKYPDSNTTVRSEEIDYVLDVKMSRSSISVWVNEKCIVNDVKFEKFGIWPHKVTVNDFMPGLITVNYTGTVSDFWFWCDKDEAPKLNAGAVAADKPVFNKSTDTNVTSKMAAIIAGKDGKYKLEKDGTITIVSNGVGEGEGSDSGAYFSAGIKRTGTMYMSTVIKAERTIDETISTMAIYGGPSLRLANATYTYSELGDQHGYLDILFTEQDGIDVRLRDKYGSDIAYIGGMSIGLKVAYPDTNNFVRGTGDYEVVVKLSMTRLSLWVNGVCVINNYKLHNVLNFDNADYHVDILDFAPGVLFNGETGTVEDFTVWCAKEDVKQARDTEYSHPTAS